MATMVARSSSIKDVIARINERRENPREALRLLKEQIATYRTLGEEIPDALVEVERDLSVECFSESQGR